MPESDLSYTRLLSISITPDGMVWVAMNYGLDLIYYDGQDWKTFDGNLARPLSGNRFSLKPGCNYPDQHVKAILTTKDGHLLVGTDQSGFVYQRP